MNSQLKCSRKLRTIIYGYLYMDELDKQLGDQGWYDQGDIYDTDDKTYLHKGLWEWVILW